LSVRLFVYTANLEVCYIATIETSTNAKKKIMI